MLVYGQSFDLPPGNGTITINLSQDIELVIERKGENTEIVAYPRNCADFETWDVIRVNDSFVRENGADFCSDTPNRKGKPHASVLR